MQNSIPSSSKLPGNESESLNSQNSTSSPAKLPGTYPQDIEFDDISSATSDTDTEISTQGITQPRKSNIEVILLNNLSQTEKNAYKRYTTTFAAIPGYKEPQTLKQALSGPEKEEWLKAVYIELKEILNKGTLKAIDSLKVLK